MELAAFLGRLHPLLVHLPIGFLVIAGVLEALSRTARFARVRPAIGPVLVLASAGALVSAGAGYLLESTGRYGGETFVRHKWLGTTLTAGAVLTMLAWFAADVSRSPTLRRAYVGLLVLTLMLLPGTGHLGGTLTYGDAYFSEHLPAFLGGRVRSPESRPPAEVRVFPTLIEPVLQSRCVGCHGPGDAQGGLRLDSPEGIRRGGESGAVVTPGRADRSEIIRRIWLPPSHQDAMPPGGRHGPTVAEATLLQWWIDQGASFDGSLADIEISPQVQPAIEALLGPVDTGQPAILAVRVPPADAGAIEAVRALGVSVAPLAANTSFLDVHCTNVGRRFGDQQLQQLVPLAKQITWLGLSGTNVSDVGLAVVGGFPHLTRLHLDRTRVTDAGLTHLAGLERLEYLNLYGTGVTDAGLAHLSKLTALRTLYLWQTAATAEGAERLRSQLPRLSVELGEIPRVPGVPGVPKVPVVPEVRGSRGSKVPDVRRFQRFEVPEVRVPEVLAVAADPPATHGKRRIPNPWNPRTRETREPWNQWNP